MVKDKFNFWIRTAGWSGLISAVGTLELYKVTGNWVFIADLILIILFSVFILTTSTETFWKKRKTMLMILFFCFVFVSIIPAIFLWLAYRQLPKK